jgi:hypothetical protein
MNSISLSSQSITALRRKGRPGVAVPVPSRLLAADGPRNAARISAYESHPNSIVLPVRIGKSVINLDVLPAAS